MVNSSQGGGSKDTWVLADAGRTALMLARHAESLFWAGRQMERAEDTARMLDVTYHGLLEAMPWEAERSWMDLLKVLWLDRPFTELEQGMRAARCRSSSCSTPTTPAPSCARSARRRENARAARELCPARCGRPSTASTWSCGLGTCGPTSRPGPTSSTASSSAAAR